MKVATFQLCWAVRFGFERKEKSKGGEACLMYTTGCDPARPSFLTQCMFVYTSSDRCVKALRAEAPCVPPPVVLNTHPHPHRLGRPIFGAAAMLLELFLHLVQLCSVTGAAASTCRLALYPRAVQQSTAKSERFMEMCYSKMNTLFFLWLEEVNMVCRAGAFTPRVWRCRVAHCSATASMFTRETAACTYCTARYSHSVDNRCWCFILCSDRSISALVSFRIPAGCRNHELARQTSEGEGWYSGLRHTNQR